jgi:hypothetical protein
MGPRAWASVKKNLVSIERHGNHRRVVARRYSNGVRPMPLISDTNMLILILVTAILFICVGALAYAMHRSRSAEGRMHDHPREPKEVELKDQDTWSD